MTNYKLIAEAVNAPLTEDELARIVPALEALQSSLAGHIEKLPQATGVWSGVTE